MEWLTGKNLTTLILAAVVLTLDLWFCGFRPGFGRPFLMVQLVICSIFLICLVLIQRGRGGGLAGAFGGMGGSSAFGTKAGDIFTWTTIVTAFIWFMLSMRLVTLTNRGISGIEFPDFETSGSATGSGTETIPAPSSAGTEPSSGGIIPKAASENTVPLLPPSGEPTPEKSLLPPALEEDSTPGKPAVPPTAPAPAPSGTPEPAKSP